jgi:hypothetical protein
VQLDRIRLSRRILVERELEIHRGLALECDLLSRRQKRRDGVEQTAGAGGNGRVDPPPEDRS